MQKDTKIVMSFVCDEDWYAMKLTKCGRFCDTCQKEVFDFTGKSKTEIIALKENEPELCGRFRIEQVDNDIICRIKLPFSKKLYAYASSIALLFATENVVAQEKPKTEQIIVNDQEKTVQTIEQPHTCNKSCPHNVNTKNTTKNFRRSRGVYLSKRFPFIIIRRFERKGKFKIPRRQLKDNRAKF